MKEPLSPLEFQDLASDLDASQVGEQLDDEHFCPERSQILESVFYSMAEAVVVADECGRTVLLNPVAERLLGQSALGVPLTQWPEQYCLYLPDQVTHTQRGEPPLARAIRGEAVDRVELFVRTAHEALGGLAARHRPSLRERPARCGGAWLSSTR